MVNLYAHIVVDTGLGVPKTVAYVAVALNPSFPSKNEGPTCPNRFLGHTWGTCAILLWFMCFGLACFQVAKNTFTD